MTTSSDSGEPIEKEILTIYESFLRGLSKELEDNPSEAILKIALDFFKVQRIDFRDMEAQRSKEAATDIKVIKETLPFEIP